MMEAVDDPIESAGERLQLADAMTADSWRIAEAARIAFADGPSAPPWERHRAADARAHRAAQRLLRAALGDRRSR